MKEMKAAAAEQATEAAGKAKTAETVTDALATLG